MGVLGQLFLYGVRRQTGDKEASIQMGEGKPFSYPTANFDISHICWWCPTTTHRPRSGTCRGRASCACSLRCRHSCKSGAVSCGG